jgi:hypothetical protein
VLCVVTITKVRTPILASQDGPRARIPEQNRRQAASPADWRRPGRSRLSVPTVVAVVFRPARNLAMTASSLPAKRSNLDDHWLTAPVVLDLHAGEKRHERVDAAAYKRRLVEREQQLAVLGV